ncbi:hypothetical protein RND81_05G263200 [Saponaria officinalis]|uniref:Uncharacterized protein n=1 Tax=Saponaria officinalis TaxID=3572 RepID=A0AAW1KXD4_SAPOF
MPREKTSSKSDGKPRKGKSRKKGSYKRNSDGSLVLPLGGHGGDVVIYADESKDTMLEFHQKSRCNAKVVCLKRDAMKKKKKALKGEIRAWVPFTCCSRLKKTQL